MKVADALRRVRLDWRALARSLPLLALIALAAGVSFEYHRLLLSQRDGIDHTYQVMMTLESALVRIIDAETGQRGYVITGDQSYLGPYQRALVEIPVSLAQLRHLVADSPEQLGRHRRLGQSLERKLAELQETVTTRQKDGLEAARAIVMRDSGRIEMDTVRQAIADMREAEAVLLRQRAGAARATERRLLLVTLACALVSVAARASLALLASRRQVG